MVRMFVRHRTADYAAWRGVYDGFEQQRRELGVTGHAGYQALGDPNDVTAWHDFSTREAAESFASSPQLREAMQQPASRVSPTSGSRPPREIGKRPRATEGAIQ